MWKILNCVPRPVLMVSSSRIMVVDNLISESLCVKMDIPWKELTTSAPAPIDILYELRATRPDLFSKIEIMIDGGVRSGADVVKALALGAKAVGLGRPFLYANGTHGQEGVVRVCQSKSRPCTPFVPVPTPWSLDVRTMRA